MKRRQSKLPPNQVVGGDSFFKPKIQPKLAMGKPGDKYEVEADRMADQVVNKKGGGDAVQKMEGEEEVQQKPLAASVTPLVQKMQVPEEEAVQAKCGECGEETVQKMEEEEPIQAMEEEEEAVQAMEEEEEPIQAMEEEEEAVQAMEEEEEAVQAMEEEEEPIQAMEEEEEAVQAKSNGNTANKPAQPSIESKLKNRSGGHKMDSKTRNEMEQGFGTDFSNVNIHTDSNAVQMSEELGAQAFTYGNDVYFNQSKYNPGSIEGKGLLAHELTHTIQQKGATQDSTESSNEQSLEGDASNTTQGVMRRMFSKGKEAGKSIMPKMKSGLRVSKCNGNKTPVTSGTQYSAGTGFNVGYSVPLVKNNIEASPGENMIFGVNASDTDKKKTTGGSWTNYAGTGPYEIGYKISGDAEFQSRGSGVTSYTDNTLQSTNVGVFVKKTWKGTSNITVTATIKDKAAATTAPDTGTAKDPDKVITWTIKKRANPCPTGLKRIRGAGATWQTAPSVYGYQGTPDIAPAGGPDYENQTVLERFGTITALGFTMADVKSTFKTANPGLNTPNKVASFVFNSGSNGTFVFDNKDRIYDQHGGFGNTSPFKASAFTDADGVGYRLPQEYVCGGTVIGNATIDRRYTIANGIEIKKTGP